MAFTKKLIKNKKQMKNFLAVLLISFSLNGFAQQKELVWHTDVDKAINLSVQTGKPLFFFFTGSDWCGWCKRLVKAVFIKPEFKTWATNNVILVEFDFNRSFKKKQQLVQQKQATFTQEEVMMLQISRSLGVGGYPTVWFVTPQPEAGKVTFNRLGSQGASPLDANAWIAGANKILKTK